jgi:UDP-N-acetyl-D-glucosamine dehydrogenase
MSRDDFFVAFSPERIDPKNDQWSIKNTPKIVAGLTPLSSKKAIDFYSKFVDSVIECESLEVAEAAKLLENTFRLINISFINEMSILSQKLGIDVNSVIKTAATKPYGFMPFYPGIGIGGHCIPVDPLYLTWWARQSGIKAAFVEAADLINLEMPKYIVERVTADNGGSLSGKSVQVIGVAYKPNIADVRETPAALVMAELELRGAIVTWHDPVVNSWNGTKSFELGGSDIAIVVTLHDVMDKALVALSATYVFDTTGKLSGVKGL